MNFLFFLICTVGMCHIIIDGNILEWFRNFIKNLAIKIGKPKWGEVVECYMCCGTWCGFLMAGLWISWNPFKIIALGFAGGFLSNFFAVLLNYLESQTIITIGRSGEKE